MKLPPPWWRKGRDAKFGCIIDVWAFTLRLPVMGGGLGGQEREGMYFWWSATPAICVLS